MAVRPHEHQSPGTPFADPPGSWLAKWATVGFGLTRRRSDPPSSESQPVELARTRAVFEDGRLRVFDADGDPMAPSAFNIAAAADPDAEISFAGGGRVQARRVAAVLEAQAGGRIGSDHGNDDAWVMAMLGIGAQPEVAAEDDLAAEDCGCALTVFGDDLMVSLAGGQAFLMAEARDRSSSCAQLLRAGTEPIQVDDVVAHVREHGVTTGAGPADEVRLGGCRTRMDGHALVVDVPGLGAVRLERSDAAASSGIPVSLFLTNGETGSLDDLLAGLSGAVHGLAGEPVAEPAARDGSAETPASLVDREHGATAPAADAAAPGSAETDSANPRRAIGLAIAVPGQVSAEEIAMIVIHGIGAGARLSAGTDNGDGSWSLMPQDLIGLSLEMPGFEQAPRQLEVRAIALKDRDGELDIWSKTIPLPHLDAHAEGSSPTDGVPVVIDRDLLAQSGAVDAVLVRGLPDGTSLSAGTFDPTIGGWVLLPAQLDDLMVTPAHGHAEDFMLTFTGLSLRNAHQARVIARIPMTRH